PHNRTPATETTPIRRQARSVRAVLPAQSRGARRLLRIGEIQGLAVFASVDLGLGTEPLPHFIIEEIPALQVTGTELALVVLFIARAHPGHANLHLCPVPEGCDCRRLRRRRL